jgi:hypothetical protein
MPTQKRRRLDQQRTRTRQRLAERGEYDTVGRARLRPGDLTPQHLQLVPLNSTRFRNTDEFLGPTGYDHVFKVTTFLASFDHFAAYNEIYADYFKPPYPARTTVQAGLYGFRIEVDILARQPPR